MSLMRCLLTFLIVSCLGLLCLPVRSQASDFNKYKELRNPYLKVTNIEERQRSEDRYVDSGGKVTLQKCPYKEVFVTAVLTQKPPSSLDTMFQASNPYFKICLQPFGADGTRQDAVCHVFRFQSLIKGNIGTASFRLTPEMARYEIHVTEKIPDRGSAIKIWNPNAQ